LAGLESLASNGPVQWLQGPFAGTTAWPRRARWPSVAWACGRLVDERLRPWLDTLALAAVAHFTGLALEGAALGFTALSLVHALSTLAAPPALIDGLEHPLGAAGALAAVAGALLGISRTPLGVKDARRRLETGAAVTVLYLAGVEVVTLAGPQHTGQTLLSVL
jgi:hypothetical protein